jgi:mannose-1-phosphate guanylyltransferase
MRYAVIIAGGAGTRLWPMSRTGKPKQLLKFIKGQSLLNIAVNRLHGLLDSNAVYICTGAAYVDQILGDMDDFDPSRVLGEPMGRDTANAVGFAAAVLAKRDPEASMAVLTADHVIEPIDVFQKALSTAFDAVEKHPELLVTFGITPTHPATGYGYVQRGEPMADLPGVHRVIAFKEKPNLETATQYVASGSYAWNSGMFVWKARTVLEQLKQQLPASYEGLMKIADAWGTSQQALVLERVYPTLPKISIDFAVMEKAPAVATVAMPVKWLDVGSWPSYGETIAPDANGNRVSEAIALLQDTTNTLVVSEGEHLVATIGLKDMIIIHTPQATLVCPANQAEKIKGVVEALQKQHGAKFV